MYLVNASSEQRLRLCGMTDSLLNKNSADLVGLNIDSLNIANLGNAFLKDCVKGKIIVSSGQTCEWKL